MSVGVLSSVVTGVSLPVFNILFGQMINTLNTDPNSFSDEVDKTCIYMVIVAGANIVAGFAQVTPFYIHCRALFLIFNCYF